jgi:hypothetical protein
MQQCTKCGSREWLQVTEDGGRPALRDIRFKGLQPIFGAWRAANKKELLPTGATVVCSKCRTSADDDLREGLSETPGFDEKPLLFIGPDHVDLDAIIARLRSTYGRQVLAVLDSDQARAAKTAPASRLANVHPATMEALRRKLGNDTPQLYEHQVRAIEHVRGGGNVILATATASGKSLCFQVPLLDGIAAGEGVERPTGLYLGPLNALIDDQFRSLAGFGAPMSKPRAGSAEALGFVARVSPGAGVDLLAAQYHGGVRPTSDDQLKHGQMKLRREIRTARPDVIFSNPEMFAAAMLPLAIDVAPPGAAEKRAAGEWRYFFERLRYVVLDECHEFRGVYGSHVANLLRRLRRVCALVGNTDPLRYVLCSATIRDPGGFAERLTGESRWLVIDRHADTSERQDRKLVFLTKKEPTQPFQDFAKGVLGVVFERERLSTIYFQESIPAVQALHARFVKSLEKGALPKDTFGVFAATFLPDEKIEKLERLRTGHMKGVASTSALALGIDIGSKGREPVRADVRRRRGRRVGAARARPWYHERIAAPSRIRHRGRAAAHQEHDPKVFGQGRAEAVSAARTQAVRQEGASAGTHHKVRAHRRWRDRRHVEFRRGEDPGQARHSLLLGRAALICGCAGTPSAWLWLRFTLLGPAPSSPCCATTDGSALQRWRCGASPS